MAEDRTKYTELEEFMETDFVNEIKDDWVRFRITKSQKKAIDKMAQDRGMKVAQLIMTLLQYEKENNVIYNKVLEKNFKRK